MPRGLDHIVHAVRDLDSAAALYKSLGFTVGARNRHPWGTHNYLVQFPGFFIELLTLAEPDKLSDDGFSRLFGRYTGEFLKSQEGLALMILESQDARADEQDFRAAGIAASETMRFEREGRRPDGTPVKVGFSLAFAEDKGAPDIHFAVCQQHYPENFWNPAFQQHANTATGIAGAVLVADAPERHRGFLEKFTGATAASKAEGGFALATPRGAIDMTTPAAFLARFGVKPPDTRSGARLAAMRFAVADADRLQ
ncbi:MAG: VOC family protein, partial [Pseudolabrys sp.]